MEIWFGPFPLVPKSMRFGLVLLLHGTFHLMFSCRFHPIGVLRSHLTLTSMSRIPGCLAVGPQPCGTSAPLFA